MAAEIVKGKGKKSHQEKVYQQLKDRIIFCDLLPGALIVETELCEQFNVSRTPVREALLRLEREGYVVIEQRKSTHVSKISLVEVRETMDLRLYIEPRVLKNLKNPLSREQKALLREMKEVFKKSAKEQESRHDLRSFLQIDYEFHTLLASLSGNSVIARHLDDLFTQSMRYWYFMFATMQKRTEQAIQEHIQIVDRLLAAEFEEAALLLEQHIRKSAELDCFS